MLTKRYLVAGLTALVLVSVIALLIGPLATKGVAAPVTRIYYVAADEVEWDYAPSGLNQITGEAFDDTANVFVQNGSDRIGKVYLKSLYREYTDATFTTRKAADARSEHLGALGPTIRAEVGDTIRVVFKNNTRFPASVHPHGVFYLKDSEGASYADGTSGANKNDDAVAPGATHTYNWAVPERAGPGPMDPSSIVWTYHSHSNETADTNAGLIGAIIITKTGKANADGSPKDVDREFVNLFTVFNENSSNYLDANIERFAGQPATVNKDDGDFQESNLMHSINGFLYGNAPGLTMKQGERVRWYLIGIGTEVDLHTPHWHANTLLWNGMRTDMIELLPMSMKVADMTADNVGTWLYHCHVNDHLDAGMIATFKVIKDLSGAALGRAMHQWGWDARVAKGRALTRQDWENEWGAVGGRLYDWAAAQYAAGAPYPMSQQRFEEWSTSQGQQSTSRR